MPHPLHRRPFADTQALARPYRMPGDHGFHRLGGVGKAPLACLLAVTMTGRTSGIRPRRPELSSQPLEDAASDVGEIAAGLPTRPPSRALPPP